MTGSDAWSSVVCVTGALPARVGEAQPPHKLAGQGGELAGPGGHPDQVRADQAHSNLALLSRQRHSAQKCHGRHLLRDAEECLKQQCLLGAVALVVVRICASLNTWAVLRILHLCFSFVESTPLDTACPFVVFMWAPFEHLCSSGPLWLLLGSHATPPGIACFHATRMADPLQIWGLLRSSGHTNQSLRDRDEDQLSELRSGNGGLSSVLNLPETLRQRSSGMVDNLELGTPLGRGSYGKVYKGAPYAQLPAAGVHAWAHRAGCAGMDSAFTRQ